MYKTFPNVFKFLLGIQALSILFIVPMKAKEMDVLNTRITTSSNANSQLELEIDVASEYRREYDARYTIINALSNDGRQDNTILGLTAHEAIAKNQLSNLRCGAGTVAPELNSTGGICGTNTLDLTTLSATNAPGGTIVLTWHSASPVTESNRVADPTAGQVGTTYYAAFRDADLNCFSPPVEFTVTTITLPTEPANVIAPSSCEGGIIAFNAQDNVEYSIDGAPFVSNPIFENLAEGNYSIVIRNTLNESCTSTISVQMPPIPEPSVAITPTNCGRISGRIRFGNIDDVFPDDMEFTVDGGKTFQSNNIFNNLPPGVYFLGYRRTIGNNPECLYLSDRGIEFEEYPPTVDIPELEFLQQPSCDFPRGRITVVEQNDAEYTIDDEPFGLERTFTDLEPGTYTIRVRKTSSTNISCEMSLEVTIADFPFVATPELEIVQPNCTTTTGRITISEQDDVEYAINNEPFGSVRTFTNLNPGAYTIRVRKTDSTSNRCEVSSEVTILESPSSLVITCPSSVTIECGESIAMADLGIPTVTESCGEVTVTFEDSELITSCSDTTGTIIRTFTVTDDRDDSVTCTQDISIVDTIAPEFTDNIPPNIFVTCNNIPEVTLTPVALDNCGRETIIKFEEIEVKDDYCVNRYSIERTWTARDACGNETPYTQFINVSCPITVHNGLSINNDGINDFFLIEGIECYTNNTVKVFNRWGVLVFETERYDNDANTFKGVSQGRVTVSPNKKLPTGTYYYVINYEYEGNGSIEKLEHSGYLYINNVN